MDVSIYARGHRLENFRGKGLRYYDKDAVQIADVRIVGAVKNDEVYDIIFLTVR